MFSMFALLRNIRRQQMGIEVRDPQPRILSRETKKEFERLRKEEGIGIDGLSHACQRRHNALLVHGLFRVKGRRLKFCND